MVKKSEKKYQKIDPWKLVLDTPFAIIGSAISLLSWPFNFFKDSSHYENIKKNTKLRVLYCLVSIDKGYEDLTDRDLKVLCNIFNLPWIQNSKSTTIINIQAKISLNSFEENTKILIKYLEPLDSELIFYLRHYCSKELYGEPDEESVKKYDKLSNFLKAGESEKQKFIEAIISIHHNTLKGQKIKINNPELVEDNEFFKLFGNISAYVSTIYTSIISTDNLSKEFDNLTKNLFEDTDTVYKAAVDSNYMADKSSYGGPYHRLFDESHSLGKMYGKIKEAKPDDSKIEEIIAWVNEAAKDVQTTMGLPITNMKKETFDKMSEYLAPIGINKNDLYDLLTYNLQEVLSAVFLGITTMFPSIKKDKKKLNTLRGVMLSAGTFGNPLALIFLVITVVHSWIKGNIQEIKKDLTSKEVAIGFSISAIIKYTFDFLGTKAVITILSILMALLIVVYFFRHKNKKINIEKFKIKFVKELENLREMSKNQIEEQKIKPLPNK